MKVFILGILILLIGISFVSAGLCKGSDGYYHDCDDIYISNYRNYDTYKEQKAYDYGYKDGYDYGFLSGYKNRDDGKYYGKIFYVKDYDDEYYEKRVYWKKDYDEKIYLKSYDKKYYWEKDYDDRYYNKKDLKKKYYVRDYDDGYYVVYEGKYKKVKAPEYYVYTWSHREGCPSGWVCHEGGW